MSLQFRGHPPVSFLRILGFFNPAFFFEIRSFIVLQFANSASLAVQQPQISTCLCPLYAPP